MMKRIKEVGYQEGKRKKQYLKKYSFYKKKYQEKKHERKRLSRWFKKKNNNNGRVKKTKRFWMENRQPIKKQKEDPLHLKKWK